MTTTDPQQSHSRRSRNKPTVSAITTSTVSTASSAPSTGAHDPSRTAQRTPDSLGLGPTQGQRSAEIVAAVRANLMPSPDTEALTRFAGRMMVRVMMSLAGKNARSGMNYVAVRSLGFSAITREVLPVQAGGGMSGMILVELAAGFSPRGIQLARELPAVRVIEVDLPDVVREKQTRLKRSPRVSIPPNIEWRSADLGLAALQDILEQQPVDLITMEGLLPYFPPDDVVHILRQVYSNLKPGGYCLCDCAWHRGMDEFRDDASLRQFKRQVGNFPTVVKDEAELRALFARGGFTNLRAYPPSEIAEKYQLPTPVTDFTFFVLARKPQQAAGQ